MPDGPVDRLRALFEEMAPPIDVEVLADALAGDTTRRSRSRVWVAVVAAVVTLALIGSAVVVVSLLDADPQQPAVTEPGSTTVPDDALPSSTTTTAEAPTTTVHPLAAEATLLDSALASLVTELDDIDSDWEARRLAFDDALTRIEALQSRVVDQLVIPWWSDPPTDTDMRLRMLLEEIQQALDAYYRGIQAPDDGTLRRAALRDVVDSVTAARVLLAEYGVQSPTVAKPAIDEEPPAGASVVIASDGTVLGWFHQDREQLGDLAPHVVAAARDLVLNDSRFGLGTRYDERRAALYGCARDASECAERGGLTIVTTVDLALQLEAERVLRRWFSTGLEPTGAIAMVDNGTGATVVMAAGLEYGADLGTGQRPYDLAGHGHRTAGSVFKPFTVIAALEQGITLDSMWDDSTPRTIELGGSLEPWVCFNASENEPGMRSLEDALVYSTNTVFCQISVLVGAESIAEVAHRFGITSPLLPVPTIGIGAAVVSPVELAAAYSTIANQGVRRHGYVIERIDGATGEQVFVHHVEPVRVAEEALTAAVVRVLERVVVMGTGTQSVLPDGRPQAGKTGSTEGGTDAWFAGFIPRYTTVVWVGNADSNEPMRSLVVGGEVIPRLYGGTVAAPIWAEFMASVVEDLEVEDFSEPEGIDSYFGGSG